MLGVSPTMAALFSQGHPILLGASHHRGMRGVSPTMAALFSQGHPVLLVASCLRGMPGVSPTMVALYSQDLGMLPLVALCLAEAVVLAEPVNKADRIAKMAAPYFRARRTKNLGTVILHHLPVPPVVDLIIICKPGARTATWEVKRTTTLQCLPARWQPVWHCWLPWRAPPRFPLRCREHHRAK
jgi:hypothetical protein